MGTETTTDRLARELRCLIDNMRMDFDRIEILLGALDGFSRRVPDYDPAFNHLLLNPRRIGKPTQSRR
jgi:hypothetical protein